MNIDDQQELRVSCEALIQAQMDYDAAHAAVKASEALRADAFERRLRAKEIIDRLTKGEPIAPPPVGR